VISLILMLTPWSPQLPAHQIWMGEEVPPISAEVLDLPQGRRFAVRAFEWVQLKRRAEAMGSYCQDAVNLATSTCVESANELLTKTRAEAEATSVNQQAVIDALEDSLRIERANLLEERRSTERLTWVTIGVSVIAVGATTVAVMR
jgi:ATP-dependent Clp protease ATP-binding subunit ClpA